MPLAPSNPRTITHAIFDMDGLLLDTEGIYTEVTQAIVARFGKTFDWSIKANMMGRRALDSARYLVETLALPMAPEEYLTEREALLAERFPHAQAMPGAEALTRQLAAAGVPMAIATSSPTHLFELKTQRHRQWFGSVFEVVVTGDDPAIKAGKPAPDIFLLAAARLGAAPERCLVFEDSPAGVEAAHAAAMAVVAVPDPRMDRERYRRADQVIDSLTAFDANSWGILAA